MSFPLDDVDPLDLAMLRLDSIPFRAQQYMDANMIDVAIQEILDPMKSLSTSRKYAQSYTDSMSIVKMGFLKIGFAIDYDRVTPNGIPINKLLEFGWDGPYEIHGNPWLHWTGGKYGAGDHFAKTVTHPGFSGYHMLHSLENWGFVDQFLFVLIEKTANYLESTAFK